MLGKSSSFKDVTSIMYGNVCRSVGIQNSRWYMSLLTQAVHELGLLGADTLTVGSCKKGRQPQWILVVADHDGRYAMKQLHGVKMDVVGAYSV
jgi:hypothetical protein